MQRNELKKRDLESRRRVVWEICLIASLPLAIVTGLAWNAHIAAIGGAAFGGGASGTNFVVVGNDGVHRLVSRGEWGMSLLLGVATLGLGFVVISAIVYFPVRYFFYPYFRHRHSRELH
jgi:hypothetical protein